MLKYPCLVLDHDDTAVQSESNVNYPFFCQVLQQFRPGSSITLEEYTHDCFHVGFGNMCRERFGFTGEELEEEFQLWLAYVRTHIPPAFPGIGRIIQKQRKLGGKICVVSHSSAENITRDYQAHFGLLPDAIYGWDLPEELRKPSTYPLENMMERYGLAPEQLLVVDDMKPGYDMASKAGVPIAFSGWGRKDFPEICRQMEGCCDYVFYSTADFERFLFDEQ